MKATSEKTGPSTVLPPSLAAEAQTTAAEERRAVLEMPQEVSVRGLEEVGWQRVLACGAERAKALGLTEKDVLRLIAEFRAESGAHGGIGVTADTNNRT